VDGKANEELIKVLAERFELPKSKIKLSPVCCPEKLIEIDTKIKICGRFTLSQPGEAIRGFPVE